MNSRCVHERVARLVEVKEDLEKKRKQAETILKPMHIDPIMSGSAGNAYLK